MTDNYEYRKSVTKQDDGDYSPFVDKQYNNYINDINNGIYTNSSLTLVNFDLGQIYNSAKHTNPSDMFIVIPISMVAAFSTGTALVNPLPGSSALCSLKSNFLNLIHQADISVQGKTLESTQPYINVCKHFQLISEMSENDLKTLGHSVGFSPVLDNPRAARYNPVQAGANGHSGNGLCNNRPFSSASEYQTASAAATTINNIANPAIQHKLSRYVDTSMSLVQNGIYGLGNTLMTPTNLANEFRPYYETKSGYMIWYDFAVIKLNHLFESMDHIGLTQKLDASLRLWLNTGTVNVTVANAGVPATMHYSITPANNTFSNTCPLLVNYEPDNRIVPATCAAIVAGVYVAKPPVTNFATINLQNSAASHPLQNCRLYYSQIQMEPEHALSYNNANKYKKVIYRTFVTNNYPATPAGGSFNQLINSGIVHPTGVLIVPFLGAVTGTNGGLGDVQWKSPFDTCPCTTSPVSLTNLQVAVGGQNVLQSTLQYGYEHFLEQVNLAEQLTSSDFGISTGLINQNYWENSKWYYVNVERGNTADKLNGRNINVSFINNSNVPIEVMVFIFYSDEIAINVTNGLVTRHKN
jgi:hypothetical protein